MYFTEKFLHRLLIELQVELAAGADSQAQGIHWSEFVADLWNVHLPHLREETYGEGEFVFDPSTNRYGFENQSDDDELLMHDLENDEVVDMFGIVLEKEDSITEVDEGISQSQVTHLHNLTQSTYKEEESDVEEEDLACELWEGVFSYKIMACISACQIKTQLKKSYKLICMLAAVYSSLLAAVGTIINHTTFSVKSRFQEDPDFQKKIVSMVQSIIMKSGVYS